MAVCGRMERTERQSNVSTVETNQGDFASV